MYNWTTSRILEWITKDFASRGIQTPRLDAELLVARALGCDRITLYMDFARPLNTRELEDIHAYIGRRRQKEPVAYILGEREFYGRKFAVTSAVLVPRPDTETLVDRALVRLKNSGGARVLDLCTGCGAIAVTLAAENSKVLVDATDISHEALSIASHNAERYGLAERIRFWGAIFSRHYSKVLWIEIVQVT